MTIVFVLPFVSVSAAPVVIRVKKNCSEIISHTNFSLIFYSISESLRPFCIIISLAISSSHRSLLLAYIVDQKASSSSIPELDCIQTALAKN